VKATNTYAPLHIYEVMELMLNSGCCGTHLCDLSEYIGMHFPLEVLYLLIETGRVVAGGGSGGVEGVNVGKKGRGGFAPGTAQFHTPPALN
jgi:hypothetical protein